MSSNVVLSSRARLARNFDDLPFDTAAHPEAAEACITRCENALALSGADRGFELIRMDQISEAERLCMLEDHQISRDLLHAVETAAVLLNRAGRLSVMMCEEDHLRIQAVADGLAVSEAADKCFRMDDALSRQVRFAFDSQLGYLTACPADTGTGMRVSLLLHLPMLTGYKQIGSVGQTVAKVGLTLRGVYGEGSEALGDVYLLSNQVTLGRTEQDLISTLSAVGEQLTDMEDALRCRALDEKRLEVEDSALRAWGVLTHARLLSQKEFFQLWSAARTGIQTGMTDFPLPLWDRMLTECQEAHLLTGEELLRGRTREQARAGRAIDQARADRVRRIVSAAG